MKNTIKLFLSFCLLSSPVFSQADNFKYEKTTTFFPNEKVINQENIEWGYLTVPENWGKPESKTIKIAVAILKSITKEKKSNPVLYIEGGPGASGIEGIWSFLEHPLREKCDIILVDTRGTGNSLPKFCPELGKKFLEILAKNQNATQDEQEKTIAAIACKQDLINRNIDINEYNSKSIAKDLNALKKVLNYENWNVYGTSYGTYEVQVYANDFPQDIKSLILDSSISDISTYYNENTANYVSSLDKLFESCKNDPNCNRQYPNLENVYYETIDKLNKKPITVVVDKKIIPDGKFTYNAEDFKVAIQQSLYVRRLIEVMPMLIYEFNKGNKNTLSALVSAFGGALSYDYGAYYCVSCNETLPFNSISKFDYNSEKNKKLKGGLSFYRSDFKVCDQWNVGINSNKNINDLSNLSSLTAPVLVFSGAFDPITPPYNGKTTVDRFKNGFLVNAPISGHAPSFSKLGFQIVDKFINNPNQHPNVTALIADNKVHFVTDVHINGGVSNLGNSLNEFNLLFFAPFFIAILVLLMTIFSYGYGLIKRKEVILGNKLLKALIVLTSIIGLFIIIQLVLALNNTAQDNFYILAFGLPSQYVYLFQLQWVFMTLTLVSIIYFSFKIKSISDASIMATILFSLILVGVYFQYWGFLL